MKLPVRISTRRENPVVPPRSALVALSLIRTGLRRRPLAAGNDNLRASGRGCPLP